MPDAQDEGLLTGLFLYGCILGALRRHAGTASACNDTKEMLTATTQMENKTTSELSRRVQANYQCKRRQPIGVTNIFAQGYRTNCKPPIAARAAAAAAGVEGRRKHSGSQSCRNCKAPHLHARDYTCRQRALKLSRVRSTPNDRRSISDVNKHRC